MNEHPDHLLADLVDGSLDDRSRAAVEEHLTSCDRCRDEVGLARDAVRSLGDLPEVPEPAGIPMAVRRETRGTPRRSWRAAGIAAAAAGLIGVGAIVVSTLGDDPAGDRAAMTTEGGGEGGGGGGRAPAPAAGAPAAESDSALSEERSTVTPLLRSTGRTYDAGDLSAIGRRFRDQARGLIEAGLAPNATAYYETFRIEALDPRTRQAYRCVIAEVPPEQLVVPFAIEAATFDGRPAYVAAFLQGPAPDRPYDRVVVWVVDREECSLLSLASQRL